MTIEEAVNTSLSFCLEKTEVAYAGHVNWQLQGEIYFSHRKFCYFVCTTKDIVVLKIARGDTYPRGTPCW